MFFLPFLLLMITPSFGAKVSVSTNYGTVEGKSFLLHNGITVNRFYGIPFAKPPVGERRWKAPEFPDKFDGVFSANRLPDACTQGMPGLISITHPLWPKERITEDCLYLNIFTPSDMTGGPYPVMVWIHGGGFVGSANFQYPGFFLAAKDVVMVAINYRLNHFGFMSTEDEASPGNYGLLDQIKALEYIRDNIAKFGGDPKKVTVFGQSAGAASGGLLMLNPKAKGLVHQVIEESGSDIAFWAYSGPEQHPANYTKEVAGKVSCPTDNSTEMMDCMRKMDWRDIYKHWFTCEPGYFCQGFAPVVDGPDGVLPDIPRRLREAGKFNKLPLLAGQCADDGSAYTVGLIPESLQGGFTREEFEDLLRNRLLTMFDALFPGKEDEVFNAINWYYSLWPYIYDKDMNRESFNQLITDFGFGVTGDEELKSQANFTDDVWYYILKYRSTKAAAIIPEWMGVPHNGEIPYVLGWPFLQKNPKLRIDTGILVDIIQWDEEDMEWAEYFTEMWTNFAKYGNPTPKPVPSPGNNEPLMWPKWRNDDQQYIHFDRKVEHRINYRQRNFALWLSYLLDMTGIELTDEKKDERAKNREGMRSNMVMENINKFYADMVAKRMKTL